MGSQSKGGNDGGGTGWARREDLCCKHRLVHGHVSSNLEIKRRKR